MSIKKVGQRGRSERSFKGRKKSRNKIDATGARHRISPRVKSVDETHNELFFALRKCQKEYLSEEMKRYRNLKVVID